MVRPKDARARFFFPSAFLRRGGLQDNAASSHSGAKTPLEIYRRSFPLLNSLPPEKGVKKITPRTAGFRGGVNPSSSFFYLPVMYGCS